MKKITLLIICIFFTVSCKTVIEEEKKEEINFDLSFFNITEIEGLDTLDDVTKKIINAALEGIDLDSLIAEMFKEMVPELNKAIKERISISPNPTSSSATIKIDMGGGDAGNASYNFRYDLIFNEKIIHKKEVKNIKENIWQDVIPEHLLQTAGMYTVAYEINFLEEGQPTFLNSKNVINFMVIKSK